MNVPGDRLTACDEDILRVSIAEGKWYALEFEVRGQRLRGYLDGKLVIEAPDARWPKGGVWLSDWRACVHFDDFSVRQLP